MNDQSPERISRRDAIKRTVQLAAGVAAFGWTGNAQAQNARQPAIGTIFPGDLKLTDQHGKEFRPAELFGDKPAIVLFGYGGCPRCQLITDTVATIQQRLEKDGKHVPIVVISVQPEEDRNNMKDYIGSYYAKGIKQFSGETLPADEEGRVKLGEQSFEAARDKPQSERIFHLVCPPTAKDAQKLQEALGLINNPNNAKDHSAFITLFKDGVKSSQYRGLPVQNAAMIADKFAKDIPAPGPAR